MGNFKKGHEKIAGRKKGSQNKFTTNLKDAFLEAFEGLGGAKGLLEWAKNKRNQPDFYKMITKMLPANVTFEGNIGNGGKRFIIEVRHTKDEIKKREDGRA